ncbi:MAG: Asp-tRNA(Asn)/Glu-tRNA(Gln) amidotransferase subunit GatC [Synechococcaceae bacterium WB5_2A_257]|nr:Asp-tRNA(Asn)/Glu-tRNA(Gln) amidotransferase subunit GatC [Synechococcaceae bacterium WB5_2A_257]
MSRISANDVRKVAQLARLDLPEHTIETFTTFTPQLEEIIDFVAQLEEIDTTDVAPTTRAVEVVNVCREDIVTNTDIREELLDLAPEREGDFFKVPKIMAD